MSKTFNKNIPYTFTGSINMSTSGNLNIPNSITTGTARITGSLNATASNHTIGSILISGGNVGINMFSPGTTSLNGDLHVTARSTGGETPAILTLQPHSPLFARGQCQIRAVSDATLGSGAGLTFSTRADNGGNFDPSALISERMRISQAGYVGIGTTSPSSLLHLSSSSDTIVNMTCSPSNSNTFIFNSTSQSRVSDLYFNPDESMWFRQRSGGTYQARFSIGSTGNVGIGMTSPVYHLDIRNTVGSSNSPFIRLGNSTGGAGNQVGIILSPFTPRTGGASSQIISIDDGNASAHLTFWTAPTGTSTTSTERIRIQNNGNVGIANDAPSNLLDIRAEARTGTHPSGLPLYISGNIGAHFNGVEIRHSNGTQGIGFGYNTIYATGSNANQDLSIRPAGSGTVYINGPLAKSSGTFDIDHPILPDKRLVHSFIEGPRCDLIYRGSVNLINGTAIINLDTDCVEENDCAMTQGTFESLCRNPQYFLQNNTSFSRVRGHIIGNQLTIICENTDSNDEIYWSVIAERKDSHIYSWKRTNNNGYLQTEYNLEN